MEMAVCSFLDATENRGKVTVSAEDDNGRLGISPTRVAQELVDGLNKCFRTAPELALCNEDVAPFDADQDICLAREIEGLTGGRSFERAVQLDQEVLTKVFLAHG